MRILTRVTASSGIDISSNNTDVITLGNSSDDKVISKAIMSASNGLFSNAVNVSTQPVTGNSTLSANDLIAFFEFKSMLSSSKGHYTTSSIGQYDITFYKIKYPGYISATWNENTDGKIISSSWVDTLGAYGLGKQLYPVELDPERRTWDSPIGYFSGSAIPLTGSWSISTFFGNAKTVSDYQKVFFANTNNTAKFYISNDNFYLSIIGSQDFKFNTSRIPPQYWGDLNKEHIVLTYNHIDQIYKLYYNGVKDSVELTSSINFSDLGGFWGIVTTCSNDSYNCPIGITPSSPFVSFLQSSHKTNTKDFAIWNKEINEYDVSAIYNNSNGVSYSQVSGGLNSIATEPFSGSISVSGNLYIIGDIQQVSGSAYLKDLSANALKTNSISSSFASFDSLSVANRIVAEQLNISGSEGSALGLQTTGKILLDGGAIQIGNYGPVYFPEAGYFYPGNALLQAVNIDSNNISLIGSNNAQILATNAQILADSVEISGSTTVSGTLNIISGGLYVNGIEITSSAGAGNIVTSGNITGSGLQSNPVTLKDNIYLSAVTASTIVSTFITSSNNIIVAATNDLTLSAAKTVVAGPTSVIGTINVISGAVLLNGENVIQSLSNSLNTTFVTIPSLSQLLEGIQFNLVSSAGENSTFYGDKKITGSLNIVLECFDRQPAPVSALTDSNTVALWKFDEASGNLIDSSPSGNNTVTKYGSSFGTAVDGLFNKAKFIDVNNYYQSTGSADLSTAFNGDHTIEGWFKTTGYNNGNLLLSYNGLGFTFQINDLITAQAQIHESNKLGYVFQRTTSDFIILTGSSIVPTGSWAHFAITREFAVIPTAETASVSTIKMYLNGVLDATYENITGSIYEVVGNKTRYLGLGCYTDVAGLGQINYNSVKPIYLDDFRVSNIARTSGEILTTYTNAFLTSSTPTTDNIFSVISENSGTILNVDVNRNINLYGPLSSNSFISSSNFIGWGNEIVKPYGVFSDTTDQTASLTTVAYPLTYNTIEESNGISIIDNSKITFAYSGTYNIQFSSQITNNKAGTATIDIWLSETGSNVARSNTKILLQGNGAHAVAAWNWVRTFASGSYAEIYWNTDDIDVFIDYQQTGSNPTRPEIPSVILTVTQV